MMTLQQVFADNKQSVANCSSSGSTQVAPINAMQAPPTDDLVQSALCTLKYHGFQLNAYEYKTQEAMNNAFIQQVSAANQVLQSTGQKPLTNSSKMLVMGAEPGTCNKFFNPATVEDWKHDDNAPVAGKVFCFTASNVSYIGWLNELSGTSDPYVYGIMAANTSQHEFLWDWWNPKHHVIFGGM